MVFLVWLKGMMLLKPALLLPGLYMLYMLSVPPGYRGLLYTGLKGGGALVVLVIGGIGGPEVEWESFIRLYKWLYGSSYCRINFLFSLLVQY